MVLDKYKILQKSTCNFPFFVALWTSQSHEHVYELQCNLAINR